MYVKPLQTIRIKNNQTHVSAKHIVMTVGAAGGLNVILKTLLNPGEEVVTFAPYFTEYGHYVNNYDGNLIVFRQIQILFSRI